ncbi:MAG: COG4280 domain-containing protein [Dehalococcoidia bacterium]
MEFVEALTIVIAMGLTRGWKSALAGVVAALAALVVFTAAAGYALSTWLPEAALQLVVGTLLLIFGLQWLRKAILRSSGRKALHDENEEFQSQTEAARKAGETQRFGLDFFGFMVSFKGVFLEGVEVVFIVITFGLSAANMPVAVTGAVAAGVLVVGAGFVVRGPLASIPENTLKYGVGLLLATFGTYWAVEGLGVFSPGGESLHWPGGDWILLALLPAWLLLSRLFVLSLRRRSDEPTPSEALA